MAEVMIKCPATNKPIAVGIDMDKESFKGSTFDDWTIARCPECGLPHTWSTPAAWLEES